MLGEKRNTFWILCTVLLAGISFTGCIGKKGSFEASMEPSIMESPEATEPPKPRTVLIEETDTAFVWTGPWSLQKNPGASGGSWMVCPEEGQPPAPGSKVEFYFRGTGITLIYLACPWCGIAEVKIDGVEYPDIDMYAEKTMVRETLITDELSDGEHVLTIVISEDKNPNSTSHLMVIDAVKVANYQPTTKTVPLTTEAPKAPSPVSSPETATYKDLYKNIATDDDILIGAFYYPWYSEHRHWIEGYKGTPSLGNYNSRNFTVISRHIDEASGHGIDFFCISWWGPGSWEDITLKNYFLKSPDIKDIKFCILYESIGRLKVDSGKINLTDIENRRRLKEDFEYLASNYFDNPQYLRVKGKPVVFIYLTRIFTGDVQNAIKELRDHIRERGYGLYLIGDQVYWQSPFEEDQKELLRAFNAVSSYNMHTSVPGIEENFIDKVVVQYEKWASVADKLEVDFIPNVMPGFDDTAVRPEARHPVIQRSVNQFRKFCEQASKFVDPDVNMILITSYNEWHEYTQVESSEEYGTTYLEVIKQTLDK